jgi:uncharacterized small protein (TIGR04563 family)
MADKKRSVYLDDESMAILAEAATRLDRSASWVVQQALKIAKPRFALVPELPKPR